MSKNKTISELVNELQKENEKLSNLKKLFDKACKLEFGFSVKEIHKLLDRQIAYEKRKAEKTNQSSLPAINNLPFHEEFGQPRG